MSPHAPIPTRAKTGLAYNVWIEFAAMSALNSELFETVPLSDVQNYWNARPCNIRHSTKTPGTKEYFDEVEQRKYRVEPHIPGFAEFEKWRGKKVLEIGCGIGTDTIQFRPRGRGVTTRDRLHVGEIARDGPEARGGVRIHGSNPLPSIG